MDGKGLIWDEDDVWLRRLASRLENRWHLKLWHFPFWHSEKVDPLKAPDSAKIRR